MSHKKVWKCKSEHSGKVSGIRNQEICQGWKSTAESLQAQPMLTN